MRLIFLFFLICSFNISAQQRNCGTMTYLQNQISNDPSISQRIINDEVLLQSWISSTSLSANNIISIPVVVHVVYNSPTENISDAQIQSQIDILNADFRRLNSDTINTPQPFTLVAADTEIEFCLASRDPDGNTTNGITRTSTTQTSFSTNDGVKFSASGGVDAWNTTKYLNIWVCDIGGGILGYAQFPGGDPTTDGIVCDYQYFGNIGTATSPYDLGRTATHEVGHWLNLRHIWGDSNCGNDFCNDTPEHSGSNYGCPTFPSTSNCSGNGSNGDMFMNYMDYTDDVCMNMFSQDQKTRMIASINTQRSGLLTSDGCQGSEYGCTDSTAINYDTLAIFDNGSCCYISGCTDPTAVNYDSNACFDDGSCMAPILGCTDSTAINYNPTANTLFAYGGELDNNFGSGGYFYNDQHLLLDVYEDCIIQSATFYAEVNNTITFELRDANGNVIDDTTHSVVPGPQQLALNFDCPIGTDLQLGLSSGSNSGLYRNNSGPSYPYDIAGALSITESSAGVPGYYYFYYNIEVEIPCSVSANYGCTDSTAFNYSPNATIDNGLCCYISGCTDSTAINYDLNACYDDNSCIYPVLGCTDSLAINYSPLANTDDGSCCYISGCTDPTAVNYDSNACFDDGSCMAPILGCTDSTAINYNPTANTLFAYGGELDNNFGSGGYFYNDQHLLLDVYEDCIIQSATFYAEVNNTITFELRDANGNVIDDTTHSVVPGPQQLVLNFDCPIGTDLQLGLSSGSNSGLYRNNSGPSYPYDIAGALSITESSAGVPGYYYFYYNIEVVSRCVLPLPSWDCINNSCVDPGDGSGQFSSLSSCELSCFAPSWDCINNSCIDPGDGSGQFSSLSSCELSCFAPSWDCINDTCIDPGDGSGQFSSLSSCELSCFAPSWDCINDTCIDPGDGSGQFSSLSSCELSCISTSLSEMNNDKFIIYPNPFNNTSTIYFSNDKLSDVQLLLFDITGRVVRVYNTNEDNITIERGALDQGIYYINLNIKDRKDLKASIVIY